MQHQTVDIYGCGVLERSGLVVFAAVLVCVPETAELRKANG
jgi:hypothetical protein